MVLLSVNESHGNEPAPLGTRPIWSGILDAATANLVALLFRLGKHGWLKFAATLSRTSRIFYKGGEKGSIFFKVPYSF